MGIAPIIIIDIECGANVVLSLNGYGYSIMYMNVNECRAHKTRGHLRSIFHVLLVKSLSNSLILYDKSFTFA